MSQNAILDSPLLRHPKPWWQPFLSLFVTLYGVLVLGWSLQPVIFLFWWEIILMSGAALVRTFFALDNRRFYDNIGQKIVFAGGGGLMLGAMILLAVTFSFQAFSGAAGTADFSRIPFQTRLLTISYAVGLILHFFANGRYKKASPADEMMRTLAHLLVLLALLMPLTMHLIPAYPELDQAKWVGVSVICVKFAVDWMFARLGNTGKLPLPEAD